MSRLSIRRFMAAISARYRLEAFFRRMGLPQTLTELGIDGSRLEEMAKKATGIAFGEESPLGNFKKLAWQDVVNIYNLCK